MAKLPRGTKRKIWAEPSLIAFNEHRDQAPARGPVSILDEGKRIPLECYGVVINGPSTVMYDTEEHKTHPRIYIETEAELQTAEDMP